MGLVIQKGPLSTRADSGLFIQFRSDVGTTRAQDKVLAPREKDPSPAAETKRALKRRQILGQRGHRPLQLIAGQLVIGRE
jgi:hypothetical protein